MLELPTKLTTPRPMRNFKQADWKEFREALERRLPELNIPGVIATVRDLEEQTQALDKDITGNNRRGGTTSQDVSVHEEVVEQRTGRVEEGIQNGTKPIVEEPTPTRSPVT
ncbi:hypothetical protein NP233_g12524 [Leucocoprinus birnbaumii]|uniref:Uncharacterized protein n=1 Tax=Leucocoprinus birnbaumii TaxID=56174 RepID=A0AAD5YJD1_9AGAR|nr:hypothetical protein NP233_g12524 [Leucocoprinus birnbaumii]